MKQTYKTEAAFAKAFRLRYLANCHAVRIESGLTGRGIPDMQCCFQGNNVWIEFKNRTPKLRHEQLVFIHRRAKALGSTLVVCCKGNEICVWHNPDSATDTGLLRDEPNWRFPVHSDPNTFTNILKFL